ncbi:hypothetical protein DL768_009334 [Monosporascus sp. mg162]|nr:hypothetical protein DL768_009334 [Monosporascus sp. mg162]
MSWASHTPERGRNIHLSPHDALVFRALDQPKESVHVPSRASSTLNGIEDSAGDQSRTRWPFSLKSYSPDIDYGKDTADALDEFESELLSDETAVHYLSSSNNHLPATDVQVLPFLDRFKDPNGPSQREEAADLREGSASAVVKPRGTDELCQLILPLLPTVGERFQQPATFEAAGLHGVLSHATTIAGSNQMNPFHYLHLEHENLDIRGSQIAVFFQHDSLGKHTTTLAISFQDGRWSKLVNEPRRRIQECLDILGEDVCGEDPFFVHLIFMTSSLRWWRNALDSFNNQLIAHLQEQMGSSQLVRADLNTIISKALHSMTAHLHRYGSELGYFEDIIAHVTQHHNDFVDDKPSRPRVEMDSHRRVSLGLREVASNLKVIGTFRKELENKTKNVLALLFNNIQVSNDKMVVTNGKVTAKLLRATREEAKLSRRIANQQQKLSESMKEDSLAMKTLATLTMFFLPGTSFAALLALPFFGEDDWMNDTSQVWLWIVLTIPSTAILFLIYWWRKRQELRASRQEEELETGAGDSEKEE